MKSHNDRAGMSEIVQTVARWLRGPILLYGIYVVLHGHLTPGGGFAGGVIVACGFILLTLANGQRFSLHLFSKTAASTFDSAGILIFLGLAVSGLLAGGRVFFENFIATPEAARFTLFSAGTIPLSNIGLGLKVASSLFLVFAVLAALRLVDGRSGEGPREP